MKKEGLKSKFILVLIVFWMTAGCATDNHHNAEQTLRPPENANPVAAKVLLEGNKLFSEHQWTAAMKKYEEAVQVQPSLAEAHYNLALTLDQQGRFSQSRPHYIKAADLAPGHPVIWNAPLFRQYGTVEPEPKEPAPDGHMGHSH